MLLRAGILLVVLSSAQAQTPRSPVAAALSASSASGSLPEMIKALDADGKAAALAGLDRLDRAALDAAALAELSEAYRLLGRPEDALKAARVLSGRDGGATAGDAQAVMSLAQAGDYAAAQAAAEGGLKRSPGDKNLLALLHEVKGRGAPAIPGESRPANSSAQTVGNKPQNIAPDTRPARLAVKVTRGSVPVPEPTREALSLEYVPAGAHKSNLLERVLRNVRVFYAMAVPNQTPDDFAQIARMRAAVDRSETGRAVVAELGGWTEIEKTVDLRMASLPKGTGGLAIPLKESRDKLFMARTMKAQPDAVAASVLAHELSHIADFRRGEGHGGLAIPSELAAHRVQVRSFLELRRGMSEEEIKKASGGYVWEYSNFIADLWTDHILSRNPDKRTFKNRFGNKDVAAMAGRAYEDLAASITAPGSPQLDYHLTAPDQGVYTMLTDEKDILDEVRAKKARGVGLTADESSELRRRAAIMTRVEKADSGYRRLHGYELGEGR